jgi:hypothetical protein
MSSETQALSSTADLTPTFHSDDVESLGGYRTLSALALVALVVGLASPLCFAAPLALAIPLVGIGLGLIALRRIDRSEGMLAGRGAALVGLALSVASLLGVLTHGQVVRALMVRQAEEFGRNWLAVLQSGETRRAFRLTSTGAEPEPPDDPLAPPMSKKDPYQEFVENSLVRRLGELGPHGKIELEQTYSYDTTVTGRCWVGQRFIVRPAASEPTAAGSRSEPVHIDLQVQRSRLPGERASRWLVLSYRDAGAAATSATVEHAH